MDRAALEAVALLAVLAGFAVVALLAVRMLAKRGVRIERDAARFNRESSVD